MRHIPLIVIVVLGGAFSLGCNSTTPVEPAETQGGSTAAESHPPADIAAPALTRRSSFEAAAAD
jgi:hypothetical protein